MNNQCIIQDASFLDPRNFHKIKQLEFMFPEKSMTIIAEMARVDVLVVQRQLVEFAKNYDAIADVCLESNSQDNTFEDEIISDEDTEKVLKCAVVKMKCKSCISCAFEFLYSLVTHTSDYNELYMVYKLVVTLAFTQVTCERNFSIMKKIKTRLRSSLSDEKLEAFMLMSFERDMEIPYNVIIDRLAATSTEMKRLLIG